MTLTISHSRQNMKQFSFTVATSNCFIANITSLRKTKSRTQVSFVEAANRKNITKVLRTFIAVSQHPLSYIQAATRRFTCCVYVSKHRMPHCSLSKILGSWKTLALPFQTNRPAYKKISGWLLFLSPAAISCLIG